MLEMARSKTSFRGGVWVVVRRKFIFMKRFLDPENVYVMVLVVAVLESMAVIRHFLISYQHVDK